MSRKLRLKPKASVFARVLQQLLDDSKFYTRAEWSQFLGVSEPALSQWVNDRTVPRADLLRMAIDLLKTRGGLMAGEALIALDAIMDEPSENISPIGSRLAPNLRSYLRVRSLAEIGRSMRDQAADHIGELYDSRAAAPNVGFNNIAPVAGIDWSESRSHGLGPAWRVPRLVRVSRPHGRERQVSVDEFASKLRIALVGTAGSGKTAFLSYLQAQHPRWHKSEGISLRNLSADRLGNWLDARNAHPRTAPVVVDGLDEMSMGYRKQAVAMIDRFAAQSPEAAILIASRPVSELERLSGFESFSIAPLSDVDLVAEITRSSFALKSPVEVDRFLCHLAERETLRPALRNPLFLKIAWSLFENSAVTPFAEALVVKEYLHVLFERDRMQGFSRVREPWAASQSLLGLLGEISLHLLHREEVTFDEPIVAKWIEKFSWNVPARKLLDLLLVLGLLTEDDQKYCFSHRVFKEYFAARSVIESAASAADYFRSASNRATMSGAMRIACSLASDATPLLETVMRSEKPHSSNFTLLAQMLAQPITAEPKVLRDSCRTLVSWLDSQTSDWKVIEDDVAGDSSASWFVFAHVGRPKEGEAIARTLRAIHQARSGPAYEPLKAHLSQARSSFLPIFSEAMEVEGRLKVNFGNGTMPKGAARVAVENLQLA